MFIIRLYEIKDDRIKFMDMSDLYIRDKDYVRAQQMLTRLQRNRNDQPDYLHDDIDDFIAFKTLVID